jgi:hypothetical protein
MKLSNETIDVLKNFSTINSGMWFKSGTKLSTVSPNKNILATAGIKDVIPSEFGIYDLNNLLRLLELEADCPELEFDKNTVIIKGLNGRSKIKYLFAAQDMIVTPPDKQITLPSVECKFTMSEKDYSWIMKTAALLSSPHIVIENKDGEIVLTTCDMKDDSKSTNSITMGEDTSEGSYKFTFATENFKMIPGTYTVEVAKKGMGHFTNTAKDIQYWITLEPKFSKYEG